MDSGTVLYYSMYGVGFVITLIFNMIFSDRFGFTKKRTAEYTSLIFVSGILGAMLMAKIKDAMITAINGAPEEKSSVCLFGCVVFMPVIMTVFYKLMGEDIDKGTDLLAPGTFLILAFSKIGCACDGCCYGKPWSWGIYNETAGCTVFPVQIFESVCTFAVFAVIIIYFFSSKHFVKGIMYPLGCMLYTPCRFVWEFFRDYSLLKTEGNFAFSMTLWQLFCIGVFAVCTVWLSLKLAKNKNLP